jgi:D-serine deaminase-like pyridoxal phosphate-dependent protein
MNAILHSSKLHPAPHPVNECDTPALLLDFDKLGRNITKLHSGVLAPVKVRAHGKAHKCPDLAKLQIAHGAIGICCQKLSEAEKFFEAGIQDIVISNQIVGELKVKRLVGLALAMKNSGATLGVCVDHELGLQQLAAALSDAKAGGGVIHVWVELDVGQGRCGVQSSAEVIALVEKIVQCKGMQFAGVQAYHGRLQHQRSVEQRLGTANEMFAKVRGVLDALLTNAASWGLSLPIAVAGGGTGSYKLEAASSLYTEIQAGSYALMDADYQRNEMPEDERFENALTVLCTVMSERTGQIVVDAGLKAFAVDSGLPVAIQPGLHVKGISDEHTVIEVTDLSLQPLIGKKLELIPGHCDPTVNLHHEFNVIQNGRVIAKWPIAAKGAGF